MKVKLQTARHAIAWSIIALVSVAPLTAAAPLPSPFTAVYDVHHSGARVGETVISMAISDNSTSDQTLYELSSVTNPKGLAKFVRSRPVIEKSIFKWSSSEELQPVHYKFEDGSKKGKRNSDIDFDWNERIATAHYKGIQKTLKLTKPVVDRLSMQVLLMRDLMNDRLKTSYKLVNKNEIKTYQIKIIGEEVLDTDAGRFNTIKILQGREGSSRYTHIWASKDHEFATVKLTLFKNQKPQTVLTINNIELEKPADPNQDPMPEAAPAASQTNDS